MSAFWRIPAERMDRSRPVAVFYWLFYGTVHGRLAIKYQCGGPWSSFPRRSPIASEVYDLQGRVAGVPPLGGTVKFGETSEMTLKRKLLEELGVEVELLSEPFVIRRCLQKSPGPQKGYAPTPPSFLKSKTPACSVFKNQEFNQVFSTFSSRRGLRVGGFIMMGSGMIASAPTMRASPSRKFGKNAAVDPSRMPLALMTTA